MLAAALKAASAARSAAEDESSVCGFRPVCEVISRELSGALTMTCVRSDERAPPVVVKKLRLDS